MGHISTNRENYVAFLLLRLILNLEGVIHEVREKLILYHIVTIETTTFLLLSTSEIKTEFPCDRTKFEVIILTGGNLRLSTEDLNYV